METQQLSGIDASFLYLETPETPMHVAGLTYFELPQGLDIGRPGLHSTGQL